MRGQGEMTNEDLRPFGNLSAEPGEIASDYKELRDCLDLMLTKSNLFVLAGVLMKLLEAGAIHRIMQPRLGVVFTFAGGSLADIAGLAIGIDLAQGALLTLCAEGRVYFKPNCAK